MTKLPTIDGRQHVEGDLTQMRHWRNILSAVAIAGAIAYAAASQAAELVVFEQAGCPWCAMFDREIAPIYGKTSEGRRAPLRRVDITQPLPPDLAFVEVERLTPLFVLIDRGREIGRIRGYPGDDHFWGLLGTLLKRLDDSGSGPDDSRSTITGKSLHAMR